MAYRSEISINTLNNKRQLRCQPIYEQETSESNLVSCTTFRQQIVAAAGFLLSKGWTNYGIAQFFNCKPHMIAMQIAKSTDPHPDSRPPKQEDFACHQRLGVGETSCPMEKGNFAHA